MNPRPLLHLEGAAVLVLTVLAYRWNHGSWVLFALRFLVGLWASSCSGTEVIRFAA